MNVENMNSCSICMDNFKHPKLLICGHTFCAGCVRSYTESTKCKHEISCPLCRKITAMPVGGIRCLLSNYYAQERKRKTQAHCDLCKKSSKSQECLMCNFIVCYECSLRHLCRQKGKDTKSTEKDGEEKSNIEGEEEIDDVTDVLLDSVPLQSRLSLKRIPTMYEAELISSFSVGVNTHSSISSINGVFPISDTEILTIPYSGPYVVVFDIYGHIKERIYVGMGLIDTFLSPDGVIFVLQSTNNSVLKHNRHQKRWDTFASFGDNFAQEMAVFPDGRVAVITIEERNIVVSNSGVKSRIFVLSTDGIVLNEIDFNQLSFRPFAITVNPVLDCMCICDNINKTVTYILADGRMLGKFFLQESELLIDMHNQSPSFLPAGLCCDENGHVIVTDAYSRMLYMLNFAGDFMGLITSTATESMGTPFVVGVSKSGIIWIGDADDGCLRVFKIKNYINYFDSLE